jgi:MFS family permease
LLDLSVFRVATFEVAQVSGGFFRVGLNALPFLLPLMFQDGFGWSPVRSGVAVAFGFVGNLAIKPVTTPMLRRFGFRVTLLVAGIAAAATVLGCALFRPGWPLPVVLAVVLLTGVFRSIGFTAYNTVAFADVPEGRIGHANTVHATLQQLAIGLGVAAGALTLRIGEAVLKVGPAAPAPYRVALVLVAGLILAGVAAGLRMPRDAGELVRSGIAR